MKLHWVKLNQISRNKGKRWIWSRTNSYQFFGNAKLAITYVLLTSNCLTACITSETFSISCVEVKFHFHPSGLENKCHFADFSVYFCLHLICTFLMEALDSRMLSTIIIISHSVEHGTVTLFYEAILWCLRFFLRRCHVN